MTEPAKDIVASILARLQNEANRQGVPFNQVLQFYAIERFLARLGKTRHVDGVLLKGALLLKTVDVPRARPTMDIDLLRQGRAERDDLIALVRDCVNVKDDSDGVIFDPASITAEEIAKDANYQGTRVLVRGKMKNVRLQVQVDFGVGDVVVPGPRVIEYPTLLDHPTVKLRAYPVEVAIAEKFEAMIDLDMENSRMKDFYDVWAYSRALPFDGKTFAESVAATFKRRRTPLPSEEAVAFTNTFYADDTHVRQWRAFVKRIGENELADRFDSIVKGVAGFLMPPAKALAGGKKFRQQWKAGGPWR